MKSEMKPIKETIPLDEARQLIADACKQIERTERVRLVDANGFAVRAEDTFGANRYDPKTLRVIDKVYTGQVPTKALEPGTAIEIATGAPMPQGAASVPSQRSASATSRCSRNRPLRSSRPATRSPILAPTCSPARSTT